MPALVGYNSVHGSQCFSYAEKVYRSENLILNKRGT